MENAVYVCARYIGVGSVNNNMSSRRLKTRLTIDAGICHRSGGSMPENVPDSKHPYYFDF